MSIRGLVIATHRDLGYFFTGVIVIYALSGLAVNHVDDWNPNFVVERREVALDLPESRAAVKREDVLGALEALDAREGYMSFDFPTERRVKIYLKDGSITGVLGSGKGEHETIRRRPFLFESNALHLHPRGWWRWFSDVFALCLIVIALTGVFVLRGKAGLAGRGKWLVAAGVLIPVLAMLAV